MERDKGESIVLRLNLILEDDYNVNHVELLNGMKISIWSFFGGFFLKEKRIT